MKLVTFVHKGQSPQIGALVDGGDTIAILQAGATARNGEVNYHHAAAETCLSLHRGDVSSSPPLIRLHSACLFGEALAGITCDCQAQLHGALKAIARDGAGVLVYLFQEGRGIGLEAKIRVLELGRVEGLDTVEAMQRADHQVDARRYDVAIAALRELDTCGQIRLISNNPDKRRQLEAGGFEVVDTVKLAYDLSPQAEDLLRTKVARMGHQVDFAGLVAKDPR